MSCRTCLHWVQPAQGGGETLHAHPEMVDWGECARVERPGALAHPTASDDWGRTLLTAPSFSCSQWEQTDGS